ncbi:hypothetical protein A0H81_08628 [Grifola frondosa]|uniref:Uncharacterized protein n=1 Tax=Grifola frondosa TaxID=5627 RepID=A0A1C7M3X9_GRIFR|nr:hypothetical protein A0H81_08628 [Grifola frondosa]
MQEGPAPRTNNVLKLMKIIDTNQSSRISQASAIHNLTECMLDASSGMQTTTADATLDFYISMLRELNTERVRNE